MEEQSPELVTSAVGRMGALTFHGEFLHSPALTAGAVRGQRVALDAAACADAAAEHVVGVQVVSTLEGRCVSHQVPSGSLLLPLAPPSPPSLPRSLPPLSLPPVSLHLCFSPISSSSSVFSSIPLSPLCPSISVSLHLSLSLTLLISLGLCLLLSFLVSPPISDSILSLCLCFSLSTCLLCACLSLSLPPPILLPLTLSPCLSSLSLSLCLSTSVHLCILVSLPISVSL